MQLITIHVFSRQNFAWSCWCWFFLGFFLKFCGKKLSAVGIVKILIFARFWCNLFLKDFLKVHSNFFGHEFIEVHYVLLDHLAHMQWIVEEAMVSTKRNQLMLRHPDFNFEPRRFLFLMQIGGFLFIIKWAMGQVKEEKEKGNSSLEIFGFAQATSQVFAFIFRLEFLCAFMLDNSLEKNLLKKDFSAK